MAIADTDIERLRESVSIVDTIQGYVQLRRVGGSRPSQKSLDNTHQLAFACGDC